MFHKSSLHFDKDNYLPRWNHKKTDWTDFGWQLQLCKQHPYRQRKLRREQDLG